MTLSHAELSTLIDDLIVDAKALNLSGIREKLSLLVPEYSPAENKPLAKVIPHPATVVHQ